MEVASAAPITAAAATESLETHGLREWGGAGGMRRSRRGEPPPSVPRGYADPAPPEEGCWPPAIPPALRLEWATATWAEWLMRAGGGSVGINTLCISGIFTLLLIRGGEKTCHGVLPARQRWETFQNERFCAALQPGTNVPRNASRVSIPGPGSRGEQGGTVRAADFPNKLCLESGALSLRGGNKSQHRSSSPAAPALGRGNLQVAAAVSHLSQREGRWAEGKDPATIQHLP